MHSALCLYTCTIIWWQNYCARQFAQTVCCHIKYYWTALGAFTSCQLKIMPIYLDLMPIRIVKIGNVARCGKVEMGMDVFGKWEWTRRKCCTISVRSWIHLDVENVPTGCWYCLEKQVFSDRLSNEGRRAASLRLYLRCLFVVGLFYSLGNALL